MIENIRVQAAFVPELGPATNIDYGPVEISRPGPNDVLVNVEHVAVNPVDTLVRSGRFSTPVPLPLILGRDLAGQIAWAQRHSQFSVGDRVWCATLGHEGRQGSFASQAVVAEDRLYRIPGRVDSASIAAISHPGTTAAHGLFELANLQAGQIVFIGGAAGNVGAAALAMAKWANARVIATCSSEDHGEVEKAGGDVVLNYADPNLSEKVAEAAPGGVDVVWDTSGRMSYSAAAAMIALRGKILVSAAGAEPASVPWASLYTRDVSVLGFVHSRASAEQMRRAAEIVNIGLEQGWLRPNISKRWPLSRARAAHEAIEQGAVRGRIVLDI